MSHLPTVRDGMLLTTPHEAPVQVETQQWFAWLREARSFTFASSVGTFTARHEERSGRRFWYAYRQRHGVLHKIYLGRSTELTLQRLEQAAQALANAGSKRHDSSSAWVSPLITTKIAVPQLGTSLVARPSAIARCLEGIARPCTVIAAPAGFGKTTLLTMACAQFRERGMQVAWVSLEETERDPVRFWTYVSAALDGAQPGIGLATHSMLQTPRPPSIEKLLTLLINILMAAKEPIALILDDYHLAATPAIDQGLTFLIEHAPTTLRLLVSTRVEPGFLLPRLRAQGRIAELHAADLRFSAEEAERFMHQTMHVSLLSDRMAQIIERTEGWVTGLQLVALSLREHAVGLELPTTASASTRYVAEYLIGEVLEHQPQDVQAFLLQTSLLERMTGPLCDAVTRRTDSAAMLVRLMQAQLFLTPLDPNLAWYRYHHLFAEILRERLQREDSTVLALCHQRAAQWFGQHGMIDDAIRHLIAAQALEEAAMLIEGEADRLVLRGETAGLVAWVRALPREVLLAHPHLCVLFAGGLFLQGEGAEATAWLNDLEQSLAEMGSRSVEIEREIAVIRAILIMVAGDITGGTATVREAAQQLPGNHLLRALALLITNILSFGEEDLFETDRTIGEFAEENLHAGNMLVAFMALVYKAGIEIYQGRLHRAAQTCREALRLVPHAGSHELPISALAYCLLGEIRREWNDLDGAEGDLRHALAIGMHLSNVELLVDGLISLAMVQAAYGRHDAALATFEELRHQIRVHQLGSLYITQMEIMRMRVLLAQGQTAEVARWAEACQRSRQEQRPISVLVPLREMEDLSLFRVALAQGYAGDVMAPLEALCTRAISAGRLRHVLEAKMLLARARWIYGEIDAALRDLDASLALAAPEGFMRVFLDEGESMANLLASYVASRPASRERAHALKLLAAFGRVIEPSALPLAETLSPRELEVLRLLATGRSNEAIASDLVVALSTVKWHVAHIYRKLGVTGRVQAVARARELHLIA